MAGAIVNKIKSFFRNERDKKYNGVNSFDFQEDEIKITKGGRKGKVVNIHSALSQKVIVAQPSRFEEMTELCECLKKRKILIVNLTRLELDVAERCFNFACGVVYALGGEIQQISSRVLLLTPANVDVTMGIEEQTTNRGRMSWLDIK